MKDSNTILVTPGINQEKQPNRNELPTLENGNTTKPNNAPPNNQEQILTQERKVNLESLKGIMCHASNEKWQTISDWQNETTKSIQD